MRILQIRIATQGDSGMKKNHTARKQYDPHLDRMGGLNINRHGIGHVLDIFIGRLKSYPARQCLIITPNGVVKISPYSKSNPRPLEDSPYLVGLYVDNKKYPLDVDQLKDDILEHMKQHKIGTLINEPTFFGVDPSSSDGDREATLIVNRGTELFISQ